MTIFTHRDSLNKVNYIGQQGEENNMYIKKMDIKCPVLESKKTQNNYLLPSHMVFSEDSRFIMIYFMPKRSKHEDAVDIKDGVYILWDIQTNSNVNVKLWGSLEHKLSSIGFPFQIWGHYNFLKEQSSLGFFDSKDSVDQMDK